MTIERVTSPASAPHTGILSIKAQLHCHLLPWVCLDGPPTGSDLRSALNPLATRLSWLSSFSITCMAVWAGQASSALTCSNTEHHGRRQTVWQAPRHVSGQKNERFFLCLSSWKGNKMPLKRKRENGPLIFSFYRLQTWNCDYATWLVRETSFFL